MNSPRQTSIAVAVLCGMFVLGFLAGITASRPLKEAFPKRNTVQEPRPEAFIQNFKDRITKHLELTPEQLPAVEAALLTMAERMRAEQRKFIPEMNRILLETVDQIMEGLDEGQRKALRERKEEMRRLPPIGGRGHGGPPPGRPDGFRGPPPARD